MYGLFIGVGCVLACILIVLIFSCCAVAQKADDNMERAFREYQLQNIEGEA